MDSTQYDAGNHRLNQSGDDCTTYATGGYVTCLGTSGDHVSSLYNEEGQLVISEHFQNNSPPTFTYNYDANGNRTRADNTATNQFREYSYLGGQLLAERDNNGLWTDYISAAGKRVATAPQQEYAIRISGSMPSNQYGFGYTVSNAFAGYTIRSGDALVVRERQTGSLEGGIVLFATDGSNNAGTPDQDGQRDDADTIRGPWHLRRIPLDNLAGRMIQRLQFGGGTGLQHQTGPFTVEFAEISLVSADGTVQTAYNAGSSVGLAYVNGPQSAVTVSQAPADSSGIHYFAADQVNTAQMEFSSAGQPLWRGEFTPFGQELSNPNTTANRYKFTGKE